MNTPLPAPLRLSYEEIKDVACQLHEKHGVGSDIPFDVEDFADLHLRLHVVTMEQLRKNYAIESWISLDKRCIYVDEWIAERQPERTRFTIAHEIGHYEMHREILSSVRPRSPEDWAYLHNRVMSIDDIEWFERQADSFAGVLLVPPEPLKKILQQEELVFKNTRGMQPDLRNPSHVEWLNSRLQTRFKVTRTVIAIRCREDGLWNPDPHYFKQTGLVDR